MTDEELYRQRLAEALAAADAATLATVRERHMIAAQSWQRLLDLKTAEAAENADSDLAVQSKKKATAWTPSA